jgi:integrase
MSRHMAGEGTIYRRQDGRWVGALYVTTTSGTRKRIYLYGKTRADVHARINERSRTERRGVPTPAHAWTVGHLLDHWINDVAATRIRSSTLTHYRSLNRNHLAPLHNCRLDRLTVERLQEHLNSLIKRNVGARTVESVRSLLRAALSQAEREELVARNVAKLTQIPSATPAPVWPWTVDEVDQFLDAAAGHRWHAAFVLSLRLGLRRGEVLGLTWAKVDLEHLTIDVAAQLQRLDGRLQLVPLKTAASRRRIALVGTVADALKKVPRGKSSHDFVFTSSTGTPVDPKNFVRTFHAIRERAGLRRIKLHHARHTAATLLKDAGVSARDAQLILGHAHITTTQQIYQHGDRDGQRSALTALERSLSAGRVDVKSDVNSIICTGQSTEIDAVTCGGPGGARTLDTLLKSLPQVLDTTTLTSVSQRLRTRAYARMCGRVAVKNCCQKTEPIGQLAMPIELAHARELDRALMHHLTNDRFPFNLVHPTTPES